MRGATTDLLARLEAMAARMDEQTGRIASLEDEIARLKSPDPGSRGGGAASEPARTTTRRGLLTGALAAGVAVTALAAAKAAPAHAADPNDVVKGATNSLNGATTIVSNANSTVPAFAGYSAKIGVEGVGQSGGTGIRGSSNAGGGPDLGGIGIGVEGRSGSGSGVYGQAMTGPGVNGYSTSNYGVYGFSLSGDAGVLGQSRQGNGVRGEGPVVGVLGLNTASGVGVQGQAGGSGYGVYGISSSGYGVTGLSSSAYGVYGKSTSLTGVYGQSTDQFGVFGASTNSFGCGGSSTAPGTAGLFGYCSTPGAIGLQGIHTVPGGLAGFFSGSVVVSGNFQVMNGAKNALVHHPDGSLRRMYCQESPEPWFEDFGTATLTNGRAAVDLDPDFDAMVKGDDYLVFMTAEGDCNGLFVSRKGPHRFVVEELKGGKSTLTFSYRLVSRRKEDVGKRLEKVQLPAVDVERLKREVEALAPAKPAPAPAKPAPGAAGVR